MKVIKTNVRFKTKYPIVDVEISNDIAPEWKYEEGQISVAGFFKGNQITQFLVLNNKQKIIREIKKFLDRNDCNLHAFNAKMEEGCFKNLGIQLDFEEIKPFHGRGTGKENMFNFLSENDIIEKDCIDFKDPLNGNSGLCMKKWKEGNREDVRKHNLCCLTKEAKIMEHRNFIIKNKEKFEQKYRRD